MTAISTEAVKELREKSGAGVMECRNALVKAGGDMEKAQEILRQKGIEKAEKKKDRVTKEGKIEAYVHMNKIGVLLEINCETDFVARNELFGNLAKEIALQIAAQGPQYISRDRIPPDVIEKQKEVIKKVAQDEGKPANILERVVEGKLEKFFRTVCLLEQAYIRDEDRKISDLIQDVIAKLGENISVNRFVRYVLGE
ncbi:MAG: translation elongation factor Ts [Candidatus Eremiobacteraeota bacterium]|nr:translation elongation factor Ts [Candidatus Eremiobacteraeota bacterium]